jgi:putative toxin-antitoxin system antitoxin component (TIGR02293 family)
MGDGVSVTPTDTSDLSELRERLKGGHREGHYYVALLGMRTYEPLEVYRSVKKGFRYSVFERFRKNTLLSHTALANLTQISERTLARRKAQGRMEPDESDRLLRASRVFGRALELFEGDRDAAMAWLTSPQRALGGLAPFELSKTDVGVQEVEHLVGRLEHGIPT